MKVDLRQLCLRHNVSARVIVVLGYRRQWDRLRPGEPAATIGS
jgi:hypothetical protein